MGRGPSMKKCLKCGDFFLYADLRRSPKNSKASLEECKWCVKVEKWERGFDLGVYTDEIEAMHATAVAERKAASDRCFQKILERQRRKAMRKRAKVKAEARVTVENGLPLIDLATDWEPHPHQRAALLARLVYAIRFLLLVAGTRGGKSEVGAYILLREALRVPGLYWCLAPWYKMLDVSERIFRKFLDPFPELFDYEKKDRRYIMASGSIVEFRSGDQPDTLRGPGVKGMWRDESSYLKDDAHRVSRTRVSDTLGWIVDTTTPKGKNLVHRDYGRGLSPEFPDHLCLHWPSNENPHFPAEEWEAAKRDLPSDFFAQEYEAKFLDNVAGVFKGFEKILQRDAVRIAQPPFLLACDLAKVKDFSVFMVMDARGQVVQFERINKISWVAQKEQIIRLQQKWNATVYLDATGVGDPIYDELVDVLGQHRVVGIKFSTSTVRQMIMALQSAVEQAQISIPEIEVLVDELRWFEYKMTPSRNVVYGAPEGFTDDCVYALALANWGRLRTAASAPPVMVSSGGAPVRRPRMGVAIGEGTRRLFDRRRRAMFRKG